MKKFLSLSLAALTLAGSLAACAPAADKLDPAITLTSSVARANAEWLDERLEVIPDDVVVGIGSNADYGIDMSEFDDDGYIARAIGGEVLLFGKTEAGLDRAVREYAKAADVGATAELNTVYHEGAPIKKLTIAGNDISEYTIIYNFDRAAKNAGADAPTFGNTEYAAKELERLILQATGIDLHVKTFDDKVTGPVISIDYYEGDDLGENGFTYKVEGGNIYIEGVGTANGCANAVYYLLEHECGWDALLFGDSDLQEADHVDIPDGVEEKVKPMFDWYYMRHMFYDDYVSDKSSFSHTYRGSVPKASHSIDRWSGINQYYYHMCYTDEGNMLTTADTIWMYVNSQVEAGQKVGEDIVAIDLGMADNAKFCVCMSCLGVLKEEGFAHSGAIIRLANFVAEQMSVDFFGIKYTVYAYHGSNVPCKTVPRDDVYITFCSDGACANHVLDGSDCSGTSGWFIKEILGKVDAQNPEYDEIDNSDYLNWIKGWCDISDHIYVYHYILPGNFAEYTYVETLYEDLHLLMDAGVEGFTPEAEYTGLGIGRLRFQLIMDIIWHPEMTKEEYESRISDHLRREYGDGGEYVWDFIELWRLTEYNTGCWDCWLYGTLVATGTIDQELYAELVPTMYGLLEKALMQCNTAAQEDRVKRLMCDVLYKECSIKYFKAYDIGDTETIKYLEGRYDLFVEYLSECGYSFETVPSYIWAFGPYAYNGVAKKVLQDNLEDAAWIDWIGYRDRLTAEGADQKPMPEKYVTATAE